jgi:hypothetical protein
MADPKETRVRSFEMNLEPSGRGGTVKLDGVDLSKLLRGVEIRTGIEQPTTVTLYCAAGQRVKLLALLPEAQVTIVIPETDPEPEEESRG